MSKYKIAAVLQHIMEPKNKRADGVPFDTSKTKINDCGGDLSKRWFIQYYIFNTDLNKLERKIYMISNAKFPTYAARLNYATKIAKEINRYLAAGYYSGSVPFGAKEKTVLSTGEAVRKIFELNEAKRKKRSNDTLRAVVVRVEGSPLAGVAIDKITHLDCLEYQDYLLKQKLSERSVNNNMAFLNTFFNEMVERDWIKEHPVGKVRKLKNREGVVNRALDTYEMKTLFTEFAKVEHDALRLYVEIIYYMWIRPREVSLLKVGDIDTVNNKIRVPGTIAKNSKTVTISIPVAFRPSLAVLGLEKRNKDLFLFSKNSNNRLFGTECVPDNHFSRYHSQVRDALGLSKEITLYGWKRSGVLNAARNGVSIHGIKMHGRWFNLSIVDHYLKKSGYNVMESEVDLMTRPF